MYKFEPLLKQTLWGGDKIIPFKHLDTQMENVGESWEISGVENNETIVANGPEKGKSLNQLVREHKDELVGKDNYSRFGNEFPLLIKFIDARQDLSIQVHPNDEIAHRQGKSRGKTEMWYALEPTPGAQLYNGLKQKITPEEYKAMVDNDTITDALARYEVHEGDVFFIPLPIASTTLSVRTRTGTIANSILSWLLKALTIPYFQTTDVVTPPR